MTAAVLLCGIPSEGPLAMVREELDLLEVPYATFNQRRFDEMDMGFGVVDGEVSGWLRVGQVAHRLEDFAGVYTRVMEDARLPELRGEALRSPRRTACRALHETLTRWYEIAPARVLNRSGPMGSNFSKPYQAQFVTEHGFSTPPTLITNDPERVREFRAHHGRIIYKSISGVRSIVQSMGDADDARLDHIRWCPVQFQAFVEGTNVRVHVVNSSVFATAISTSSTDYRYAHHDPEGDALLEPFDLADDLAERCVALARALELPFAGIDLKLSPEGEAFCFEVNPSPAFSYYEGHTGQQIARAVAEYLAGGQDEHRSAP